MMAALSNWKLHLLLLAVVLLGLLGVRSARLKAKLEAADRELRDLQGYRDTRRELDEVEKLLGDDPVSARNFLRDRKPGRP